MKIAPKERRERGKRGPREGDGGRPEYELRTDPDRLVIVATHWAIHRLGEDWKRRKLGALLQGFDNLFTPHDCVEIALGTESKDGIEYEQQSIINTTAPSSVVPDPDGRQRLYAPGGKTLRRSRNQLLKAKFERYRPKRRTEDENSKWLRYCVKALDLIVDSGKELSNPETGRRLLFPKDPMVIGFSMLASAGLEVPEAACKRLVEFLLNLAK